MTIEFADFKSPPGLWVATGSSIVPLETAVGAIAFVGAAIQSGIGDPSDAAAIEAMAAAANESA